MTEFATPEDRKAREAALKEWIHATFPEPDWQGDLDFGCVGAKTLLYSATFQGNLYAMVLDGHQPERPFWADNSDLSPSDILFAALSRLMQTRTACWALLLCHDGAYWELRKVWIAHPEYVWAAFFELQTQPADEGGPSRLALIFDDHESVVVFDHTFDHIAPYAPRFDIAFYGSDDHRDHLITLLNDHGIPFRYV